MAVSVENVGVYKPVCSNCGSQYNSTINQRTYLNSKDQWDNWLCSDCGGESEIDSNDSLEVKDINGVLIKSNSKVSLTNQMGKETTATVQEQRARKIVDGRVEYMFTKKLKSKCGFICSISDFSVKRYNIKVIGEV